MAKRERATIPMRPWGKWMAPLERHGSRSDDSMQAASVLTCLWPGLPRLWLQGKLSGLFVALLFGFALNLALTSSFVFPNLLGFGTVRIIWLVVVTSWLVATWRNLNKLQSSSMPSASSPANEDLFLKAQTEYLNGHWLESESLLRRLLKSNPTDVDTQLMLATLFRHARRYDEARTQLESLERLPGSRKWILEISQEYQLLNGLVAKPKVGDDTENEIDELPPQSALARAA